MDRSKHAKDSLEKIRMSPGCDFDALNSLIEICPKYVDVLEKRSKCHLANNESEMAIGDLARAMKLSPNSNHIALELSTLYSSIGELDSANSVIKECLRHDPEHRACKKQFRKVKGLQKQLAALEKMKNKKKWAAILSVLFTEEKFAEEVEQLGAKPLLKDVYLYACEAYHFAKNYENAINFCSKVLNIQEELLEARILRAESYLAIDEFEKAKNDFQQAYESDRQNERVVSCLFRSLMDSERRKHC
jgi:tetratricopeptide (TPR) repeat protein